MKRYISLACVALVIIMCMVSPVYAQQITFSNLIQVLDYSTADNSGSNYLSFTDSVIVRYEIPAESDYNYVDMLINCAGSPLTSVMVGGYDSALHNINFVRVSNDYYRIYGSFSSAFFPELVLKFNTSGQSWITILSLQVGLSGYSSMDIESYCEISSYAYNGVIHYVPTDEINYRTFDGPTNFDMSDYTLFVYLNDIWKKYDYVDFLLMTNVSSVISITAGLGSEIIPFSISYLDNDSMDHRFIYSIRLDLRSLDRTSSDFPMVTIAGNLIFDDTNTISVLGTTGYVATVAQDPDVFWLNRIFNRFADLGQWIADQTASINQTQWDVFQFLRTDLVNHFNNLINSLGVHFTDLGNWLQTHVTNITETMWSTLGFLRDDLFGYFSNLNSWLDNQTSTLEAAIRGDTSPGDSFQQEVDQKDQQLNDMAAVMDSVNKPQIDSVNVSADTYVDQTVLATSMSGLTAVISMPVFLDVIMMALIMATAGYVLFGKR